MSCSRAQFSRWCYRGRTPRAAMALALQQQGRDPYGPFEIWREERAAQIFGGRGLSWTQPIGKPTGCGVACQVIWQGVPPLFT